MKAILIILQFSIIILMPILKIQYDISIWFGAILLLITAFFLMIKEDYTPPQTL